MADEVTQLVSIFHIVHFIIRRLSKARRLYLDLNLEPNADPDATPEEVLLCNLINEWLSEYNGCKLRGAPAHGSRE